MAKIGQYQVGELLGEGGLGRVHAGYDTVLGREVAIKSLRPEFLNDAAVVARFRSEATNLARLNHPNITTVHALLEEGRSLYIVMERVRGHTLEALLKFRNGGLGHSESLAVFAQAAEGLAYAHSMGVIHRDIKPANIMVVPTSGLVKIMDFGIARLRGSVQRQTREGIVVGTLPYMAPEQIRGEAASERSDLYSLAIVLYEMLAGAPPFAGSNDFELMQAHINAKPPRLSSRIPDADSRIDGALQRALAKKPEQRFASVPEFRDAVIQSSQRHSTARSLLTGLAGGSRTAGSETSLTERIRRLGATVAKLSLTSAGDTPQRRLAGIPAGKILPLAVGATALGAGVALWLAFFSGSQAPLEPAAAPTTAKMPAANQSALAQPPRSPESDPSVVLAPSELHQGRPIGVDK